MTKAAKTLELKFERTIPAPPGEVYAAWLNPKKPGNPWNIADKLLFNPKVDGFFYWLIHGTPHYGRFTKIERPRHIQHTWMSPYTSGEESTVTVTFKKKGKGTLMTLVHSGLPDNERGLMHKEGWSEFLDGFPKQFTDAPRKKKRPLSR
jgi:uncharacterized protein YndB with AHSA1/START domain